MVDPKRLIESMELCKSAERDCHKCMYCETENDCRNSMIYDAVELLKEQEANKVTVRPVVYADSPKAYEAYHSVSGGTTRPIANGDESYCCDVCGETVGWEELDVSGIDPVRYKYCPGCGRRVKWDEAD